jgi:hypothetical protein
MPEDGLTYLYKPLKQFLEELGEENLEDSRNNNN